MPLYYILNEKHEPIEADMFEANQWLMDADRRRVGFDTVGDFDVSTVFLCIDHRFSGKGPPILFETMIFKKGSSSDLYCKRYTSLAKAKAGHRLAVKLAKKGKFE